VLINVEMAFILTVHTVKIAMTLVILAQKQLNVKHVRTLIC